MYHHSKLPVVLYRILVHVHVWYTVSTVYRYKGTVRLHAKVHTTEYIYMYATVQCTEKVISCFPDWRVSEYRAFTVIRPESS